VAAAQKVPVDQVFVAAFSEQLAAQERLRLQAERASREILLAVLDKVPDVEPDEFDRL